MIDDPSAQRNHPPQPTFSAIAEQEVEAVLDRYGYPRETKDIITSENLLPLGLLNRLHAQYPEYSGLLAAGERWFEDRYYEGLAGFRKVAAILAENGVKLSDLAERELFVEVYRFKASRHALNSINWKDYEHDSLFQLLFPQPGVMPKELLARYSAEASPEKRSGMASDYVHQTNPHDGHQLLNKPWLELEDGGIQLVDGCQHKYPQCMLVFDRTTQECFSFCTYCFRHAQVRGDHDMFVQEDIDQVHVYLREHKEVTDVLITGGDAGHLPAGRFRRYLLPLLEDPRLLHVRTIRLGSRLLSYEPEHILTRPYEDMLALFDLAHDNGIEIAWVAHFSTPRELLNPATIAAIRRLQRHGVVVRSQSPIMKHISLFTDSKGKVDIERSAKNWIDLANLLGTLSIRFHAMYCARATGEHHYFTAPLADIDRVFSLIYRSVSSFKRPSRYITMTTSAGKISLLGTTEIEGRKAFVLKFNEARNMQWMDRVFLAEFDEETARIDFLTPFEADEFFFEKELREIELGLLEVQRQAGATPP